MLCLLELGNAAVYHAFERTLERLDSVEHHFLTELGLSDIDAFVAYNLAPLRLRKDIAMLGLLGSTRGAAHPSLCALFEFKRGVIHNYGTRTAKLRHDKQLVDPCRPSDLDMMSRSIFDLARVFHLLPPVVVDSGSVTKFQRSLTQMAKKLRRSGYPAWFKRFSPRSLVTHSKICLSLMQWQWLLLPCLLPTPSSSFTPTGRRHVVTQSRSYGVTVLHRHVGKLFVTSAPPHVVAASRHDQTEEVKTLFGRRCCLLLTPCIQPLPLLSCYHNCCVAML